MLDSGTEAPYDAPVVPGDGELRMNQEITQICRETVDALERFCREQEGTLSRLVRAITTQFADGGHLLLAGSGPFQPLAQLIASHFVFHLSYDRPVLPALCLGGDPILNNPMFGAAHHDKHLVRHYRALNSPQHLLVLLNDGSADPALQVVRDEVLENDQPVALISPDCGQDSLFDTDIEFCLDLGGSSVPRQLELVQFTGHLLCQLVEKELFGR